jgi:hypothetical protein
MRFIDINGDSVRLTDAYKNNDQLMKAHERWKSTDGGKQFYELFGEGGKYENVAVVFDAKPSGEMPEAGDEGLTTLELVQGDKATKIGDRKVSSDVKDAAKGKGTNTYLRFTLSINSSYDYNLRASDFAELIDTHTHETQHLMIDVTGIIKYGKIEDPYDQHVKMQNTDLPYYQIRYKSFWQIKDIWTPSYMEQREKKYKRDVIKFVNDEMNGFRL